MAGIEQEPGKPLDESLPPYLRRAILAAGLGDALGFTFDLTNPAPPLPEDQTAGLDLRTFLQVRGRPLEHPGYSFQPYISQEELEAARTAEPDFYIESPPGMPALVVVRRGRFEHHTTIETPRQVDIVNLLADHPREPFTIKDILGEVRGPGHTKQSVSQNLLSIRSRTSDMRGPVVRDQINSGRKLYTLDVAHVIRGLPQAS